LFTSGNTLTNSVCYLSLATTFTVAFWHKSGNPAQGAGYIANNNDGGPQISVISGFATSGGFDEIEFFTSGGGSDFRTGSQIPTPDSNWHHYAYRSNGATGEWALFVDGVKTVINATLFGTLPQITGPACTLILGGSEMSLARYYISTAALSDGQIAAMAGATCSTSGVSGTVLYALLGQGSPDPEHSPSPNTNSFTVTGATVSTGPSCSGT
jgi:hypothetical protein